jgi:quinol monooxygenase YgiN
MGLGLGSSFALLDYALQSCSMISAIWEFRVHPGHVIEYENHYGPDGTWARLFRRSASYLGTQLLRDQDDPLRYVTIDAWLDLGAYKVMKCDPEYARLDKVCEKLTTEERLIGIFES